MKVFSIHYFENLLGAASQSHRLRAYANVHRSYNEKCQKLFNAIKVNSYIRPNRYFLGLKEGCLMAIKGLFGVIMFTDQGLIRSVIIFGSEKYSEKLSIQSGLELLACAWHTIVSLVDGSSLLEVKSGPFDPSLVKNWRLGRLKRVMIAP